jgi:hypothetical protein
LNAVSTDIQISEAPASENVTSTSPNANAIPFLPAQMQERNGGNNGHVPREHVENILSIAPATMGPR